MGSVRPRRPVASRPLRRALLGVALVGLAQSMPAHANDSAAHLGAGGIILSATDAVAMRQEDLFVSTAEIRVRYRFFNRTDREVTTLVALPLPDVRAPSEEDNFVIPRPDQATNFLDFETRVDGAKVAMLVEQRALALGIDRTKLLQSLGLPLAPHDRSLPGLLAGLPDAERERLRHLGMIKDLSYLGPSPIGRIRPLWSARTTYFWEQRFPAGREVIVEHRYVPSVGGAAQSALANRHAGAAMRRDYVERYCVAESFMREVQKWHGRPARESTLEYVLTSGANWAGAIGEFRLTIDKGARENLMSVCIDGLRQISPTRYEVTRTDFRPRRNLEVLILAPRH